MNLRHPQRGNHIKVTAELHLIYPHQILTDAWQEISFQ